MSEVVNVPDLALQFFDLNGKPLVNGKLAFFKNNTDIPARVCSSDGSVSLGSEITLDASGFPSTQFSLLAGLEYTVKAFDSNNVLLWTRNNVFGSGEGSGGVGNWVPMEGTTSDDPITGPLVFKTDQAQNSTDSYGTTLTNSQGGATYLVRDGLDIQIATSRGQYNANKLELSNTQNGFPGYPDKSTLNTTSLTLTREVAGDGGTRVEKQVELKTATSNLSANQMNFKGNTSISGDGYLLVNALSGAINITGKGIELNTSDSSNVVVGAQSKLIAKTLGIGTPLSNKEVSDIWTSTSTGAMTDDQLITAKAAYDMSGGGGSDWHVYKYEPRPIAPVRLSWDPAGQTNKTLCWVDVLPPGLTFSKVYLFPDSVSWGDNMKTAPDRYGWAVYRRKKIDIRALNRGETYSKNACTGQFVNGLFEISSTPVSIPDDEYVYFIGIMVSSFYQSSYSLNINLIGTDPVDYHNWSGIGMPAGAFTNYTDLGPSIRGYATDGAMVSLPDNYIACGNYNTSPYNQRISFPWWACK